MNGLRDFLRTIKRVHFWIICPTIIVLGTVTWFMVSSRLTNEKEKRVTSIKGLYNSVNETQNAELLANQDVQDGMQSLIDKRRTEVEEAWTQKWEQQSAEETGIFTWPEELGADFIRRVEGLRPIEQKVKYPPEKKNPEGQSAAKISRLHQTGTS